MEQQTKRPFLLAGLIINIVCFAILSIGSLVLVFAAAQVLSDINASDTGAAVFVMAIYILILAFCVLGLVFSAVSITRVKLSPVEFNRRKGMVLTSFIFDIIIIVFIIIGLTSGFDVLSFIMALCLICAAVFIMLDYAKNPKLMTQASATQANAPVDANAQVNVQPQDANVDEVKTEEETQASEEKKD